jgi:hypothetical protein
MARAEDGIAWTAVAGGTSTTPGDSTFGNGRINAIAYGADRFVAADNNGFMARSEDGITWVGAGSFGTASINGITYGNGMFLAVGATGFLGNNMGRSEAGITWTAVPNNTFGTGTINGIAYGTGMFVAFGPSNRMAYSTDSVNWTAVTGGANITISAMTYGAGRFVLARGSSMAYSTDGITWTGAGAIRWPTESGTSTTGTFYGIAYGSGRFVAVGNNGRMAYSNLQE